MSTESTGPGIIGKRDGKMEYNIYSFLSLRLSRISDRIHTEEERESSFKTNLFDLLVLHPHLEALKRSTKL